MARDTLRNLAIVATGISAVMALVVALLFGTSPLYAYSAVSRVEWSNPSDIAMVVLLYAPVPLWIAFILSRGAN